MIEFTVYGIPQHQGSARAFVPKGWKRPVITSTNAKLKPWRQDVIDTCRQLYSGAPMDCPVQVRATFYFPRPKSTPRRVTEKATIPDLDKHLRALCDAITAAGIWKDDSRLVHADAWKAFAGGHRDPEGEAGVPRTVVRVEEV